ncbi:D-alanyl-D-alanine carboxypeptidase family protein [Herbiconiux liangxiaofengii]|uniref:D-alanyl-D-alanine carboxypeptidase family protein n=1 Tax=Herbiconiux liangxiaofengii TaxID=3342795 RepID=UPI0035BB17CC
MAGSPGRKVLRAVVIMIGALVILAVGVYGPATLVGPLPPATATVVQAPADAATTAVPALPQTGASAVMASGSDAVLTSGGEAAAVPIGGTAKVITALVVLDAKPLAAGAAGESVPITQEDYASYVQYLSERARAISFIAGETWSQREMLQAMLLGSSNNHADALARWAFGSIDGYLAAAQAWLTEKGLTSVQLVDTNGLAEGDVGTASDLARIASLAMADPAIAEIMASSDARVNGNRPVENLAKYATDQGYTGLSRSYTDEAGVCFLFALDVTTDAGSVTLVGAFLREPDWETLDADLAALASTAATTIRSTPVVTEGQSYVTYTTDWGESANGVAMGTESRLLWVTTPLEYQVDAKTLSTGSRGEQVGSVTVTTPDGPLNVLLELDGRIGDPGPFWRLTHPVPVIEAFIDSRFG